MDEFKNNLKGFDEMREIKFRGFCESLDKWVYGYFSINKYGEHYIENHNGMYLVVKESVGQFTNLTDQNGVEIYESDILKFEHLHNYSNEIQLVSMYKFFWGTGEYGFYEMVERDYKFEIIGNLYENPEIQIFY